MAIFIKYWLASTSHVDPQCILRKFDADDFGWINKRIRHFDHLVASRVWLAHKRTGTPAIASSGSSCGPLRGAAVKSDRE
jgi:hypothetical protein